MFLLEASLAGAPGIRRKCPDCPVFELQFSQGLQEAAAEYRALLDAKPDYLEALAAKRLAGLCSGVVELAGLTNHDRPRAYDEYLVNVGSSWHRLLGLFRWSCSLFQGSRGLFGDACRHRDCR